MVCGACGRGARGRTQRQRTATPPPPSPHLVQHQQRAREEGERGSARPAAQPPEALAVGAHVERDAAARGRHGGRWPPETRRRRGAPRRRWPPDAPPTAVQTTRGCAGVGRTASRPGWAAGRALLDRLTGRDLGLVWVAKGYDQDHGRARKRRAAAWHRLPPHCGVAAKYDAAAPDPARTAAAAPSSNSSSPSSSARLRHQPVGIVAPIFYTQVPGGAQADSARVRLHTRGAASRRGCETG